jgi:Hypothetical glycosyl hydrolase 6
MDNPPTLSTGPTRREFLIQAAAVTALVAANPRAAPADSQVNAPQPWYRNTLRWGQTNITEADVDRYDIAWWRQQWKRTAVQGVIINAGGIVAYYPSEIPLHYHAPTLKGRDLYGELAQAAHDDGLAVLARMDSSKAHDGLYRAHPDWFAVDAAARPYRSGEFYLSCINGPYYQEFLPDIMREIIGRSHPQGIADNIWSGLDRNSICFCGNCARRFRDYATMELPARHDWNDTAFRKWIEWSYARRIEQWEFNNQVTQKAGGEDCLWIGMNGASASSQSASFRDMREIFTRAKLILLDSQSRNDANGFQENALAGKLVHSLAGWDKLMPESMAMYQHGRPQFRFSSKPAAEARMWMLAGFAGGILPWWHHVGAYQEDRRAFSTAAPMMQWHRANQEYLVNRVPVASVAVGWSQRNMDFFGRDSAEDLVEQPWRGFTQALVRARIPFVPVHLDDLDRDGGRFSVLVLPNIGVVTDEQIAAVRRFVRRGGALVATGQTSLFDQWGDARPDFAMADLFGVKGGQPNAVNAAPLHSYMRLSVQPRHEILAGFEQTDILSFGGRLQPLSVGSNAQVLLTFIPPFPETPPELVWMREPKTDIPGLIVNESGGGRVVFMPADIDRRFALYNLPDHGDLLANIVRWAAGDSIPLAVQGPGLLDCELYRQRDRLILHVVNLTSAGTWRAPVDELIAVGPIQIAARLPDGISATRCRSLATGGGGPIASRIENGWIKFALPSVLDHEVIVMES